MLPLRVGRKDLRPICNRLIRRLLRRIGSTVRDNIRSALEVQSECLELHRQHVYIINLPNAAFHLQKYLYLLKELKLNVMTSTTLKKQFDGYLPLLSSKQQALVLDMVKSLLNIDNDVKRITRKQYNKEIDEAVNRVEEGNFVTHEDALKELSI